MVAAHSYDPSIKKNDKRKIIHVLVRYEAKKITAILTESKDHQVNRNNLQVLDKNMLSGS